jgi:hypothetical protein
VYEERGPYDGTMRPRWELHLEPEPLSPLDGIARDLSLVSDVSAGRRAAVMRLWQPDRTVVLVADGTSRVSQRADVSIVARPTPGPLWFAAGPAAILWSTIATSETFGISETEDPLKVQEFVRAVLDDPSITIDVPHDLSTIHITQGAALSLSRT